MICEESRVELLLKVFEAFDLDGSGQVESSELLHLGERVLQKIHRDLDGDRASSRMSPRNSLAGDLSGPGELASNPAPADQPIMFRRTKSALSQLSCTIFGASGSASPGNTTSSLAVEIAEPNEDMIAQRIQDSDVTKVKQPGSESLSPIPIPGPGPEQSPSGFVLRRAETSTSESTRYAKRDKAPSA